LPGVPGRLLLLLAGFELGLGLLLLGFELGGWTWTKESLTVLGGTEKGSSDIIFWSEEKLCVLN